VSPLDDEPFNVHSQLLRTRRTRPTLRDVQSVSAGSDANRWPHHPVADGRRLVFERYVEELGLDRPLAVLLELVLEGARGPILCHGLGTDDAGLLRLERAFTRMTGKSVYLCAITVLERSTRANRASPVKANGHTQLG
jgi:hypothetical protein